MTDPIIDIQALERVHAQSDARLAEVLAGWDKTRELMEKLRESQIRLEATIDQNSKTLNSSKGNWRE
jgi:chromosome condensin MukBEF ATPase and DNA-binding subunit MukB